MECQPARTLPQAAVTPLRIGRSLQSSASDAACPRPILTFGLYRVERSLLHFWKATSQARPQPWVKPGKTNFSATSSNHVRSKSLQINTRPHCRAEARLPDRGSVKPGKTKSITIAMSEPLPIPDQPQPSPFPSAVRCEIFVVPNPNNNLSPIRGDISCPSARRYRSAGAWNVIGNGAQAGHAPVKPGKTNFTGPCANHFSPPSPWTNWAASSIDLTQSVRSIMQA